MKLIKRIDIPCGQTYLIETVDGNYLECGDVFMSRETAYGTRPYRFDDFDDPSDFNKRVMTICTMAGCPMGCHFCASARTYKRKLSAKEIVGQVEFMIQNGLPLGRDGDPNNAQEFRVLYTRMGEPMLNADAVIASVKELIRRYPKVVIGMSTSGHLAGVEKFLQNPEILSSIDMQFSLHSTDDEERKKLFDVNVGIAMMSIPQVAQAVKKWFAITKKKVSLNMILFEGYTYDIPALLRHFDKDQIWLRLSPWNVVETAKEEYSFNGLLKTEDVLSKKPLTSERLKQIIGDAVASRVAYAYAPAIDKEIEHKVACGQALEAFKDELRKMNVDRVVNA